MEAFQTEGRRYVWLRQNVRRLPLLLAGESTFYTHCHPGKGALCTLFPATTTLV